MAKFKAGESGNPGGRPSGHGEIREIARQHTGRAITILATIMNDADATPSARVGAATALLDRGWGRPAQTIEASFNPGFGAMDSALDGMAAGLLAKMRKDTPSMETSGNQVLMAEGGNA